MVRQTTYFLILAALCSVALGEQPAEPFKPGKLPPAEVAALKQGLTLRFSKDGTPLDARRVRLAALHVPAGDAPSPFIAPGPFTAKLSGYIKNPLKNAYSFRLVGSGSIVLKINDKVVLKEMDKEAEVELAKNYNTIEIDYVSPQKGDATLRLYWASEKFGFEPVPPDVLSSRGDEKDLAEQTALRDGRQLFANRHCGHCHGGTKSEMPELRVAWDDAMPRLDDVGYRFQQDWLAAWIVNPRSVRQDASMPRMLTGPDAPKHAADIAAYLVSLKKYAEPKPLGKNPKASDGAALFAKLGCVSCHRLDDPQAKDELDRLSLYHVAAKFAPHALAHFLKQPHHRYPWTRMPDFKLSDDEAGHLEAFLRANTKGKFDARPKGDAQRGEKLFADVSEIAAIHAVGIERLAHPRCSCRRLALDSVVFFAEGPRQSPRFCAERIGACHPERVPENRPEVADARNARRILAAPGASAAMRLVPSPRWGKHALARGPRRRRQNAGSVAELDLDRRKIEARMDAKVAGRHARSARPSVDQGPHARVSCPCRDARRRPCRHRARLRVGQRRQPSRRQLSHRSAS